MTALEETGDIGDLTDAHYLMGLIYEKTGDDEHALEYLIKAADDLESLRSRLTVEEHKMSFMMNRMMIYESLIRLLLKQSRIQDAWSYAERAKARAFLDMMGNRRVHPKTGASSELAAKAEELDDAIMEQRALLENEESRKKRPEIYARLTELQKAYEENLERLKISNPEYASMRSVNVASLEETQGTLDKDSLILEYFIGSEKSTLFIIGQNNLDAVELNATSEAIRERVISLRNKISSKSLDAEHLEALSRILLPEKALDAINGKRRLIIIPHSSLHYLPFSLLKDSKGRQLVKNFDILISPSASVWRLCMARKKARDEKFLGLALGDTAVSFREGTKGAVRGTIALSPQLTREGLPPLPGTKKEVEEIGALFSRKQILIGADMRSDRVGKEIRGKDIVHFATHGLLDPRHPIFSGLVLSDRILTTAEIFDLDIDAGLVVLSACNTAGGELSGGDDIVGISRAFMYAGAPMVIASLWSVSDESTAALMQSFYRELKSGGDVAEALRRAELDTMRQYPDPYNWAPFILIGGQN